jgi:hypothetical protein
MVVSGQLHSPAAFTPGERAPLYHWTGGWMGPRSGLAMKLEEKSFASVGNRTSVVQSVVRQFTKLPQLLYMSI